MENMEADQANNKLLSTVSGKWQRILSTTALPMITKETISIPFDDIKSQCTPIVFNSYHAKEILFVDSSRTKFEDHCISVVILS